MKFESEDYLGLHTFCRFKHMKFLILLFPTSSKPLTEFLPYARQYTHCLGIYKNERACPCFPEIHRKSHVGITALQGKLVSLILRYWTIAVLGRSFILSGDDGTLWNHTEFGPKHNLDTQGYEGDNVTRPFHSQVFTQEKWKHVHIKLVHEYS